MAEPTTPSEPIAAAPDSGDRLDWVAAVGSDWWATVVGLAIAALAVMGLLPRIPW